MSTQSIYKQDEDVAKKLARFDVTKEELLGVAMQAIAARNETTPLHPANAPGMYSYMEGVAGLRMIFLPKPGWKLSRNKGVESVSNEELGVVIVFQNVDVACGEQAPCPLTGKGCGVAELVENPTGFLWPEMENLADSVAENKQVWFFCVSTLSNADKPVKAELSRPQAIVNGSFERFAERIFIEQTDPMIENSTGKSDPADMLEFEVNISRKV